MIRIELPRVLIDALKRADEAQASGFRLWRKMHGLEWVDELKQAKKERKDA